MNLRVGLFDSGIGGLTILAPIRRQFPFLELHYLADQGYAPYGDKPEPWVSDRTMTMIGWFLAQGMDAIVVACNTATAIAIDQARQQYSAHLIPFVGVEPAVKPALSLAPAEKIAVLVTSATAQSSRFFNLCLRLGGGNMAIIPCPGWVEALETGLENPQIIELVAKTLVPLQNQGFSVFVLGCTHFPLLLPILQQIAPQATFLEPSYAVSQQLARVLGLSSSQTSIISSQPRLYSTSAQVSARTVLQRTYQQLLAEEGLVDVSYLAL